MAATTPYEAAPKAVMDRSRLALYAQCIPALETVLRLAPEHARANYLMAMARAWLGETRPTLPFFEQAVHAEPHLGQLPDFFDLLSRNYMSQGLYEEGLNTSEKASRLAVAAGRSQQAAKLQQRAEECRRLGAVGKR
jgi:tetratricopeptide (TPR) repeat protein